VVGEILDYDLDRIEGQTDKLIGLVQEKYGYARAQAEQEVERRFKEWNDKTAGTFTKVTTTAQQLGASAATRANEAATAVGEKIASGWLVFAGEESRRPGTQRYVGDPHLPPPVIAHWHRSGLFAWPGLVVFHRGSWSRRQERMA
jgi:uncharacterized protein YjbJ (UPF0337 family)